MKVGIIGGDIIRTETIVGLDLLVQKTYLISGAALPTVGAEELVWRNSAVT